MNAFELARYRAGLPLAEAAKRAEVGERTIRRLELGETVQPSAPVVKALADVYGVSVDALLGLEPAA